MRGTKGILSQTRNASVVLFTMAILIVTSPAVAGDQERCVRAELPRSVVLPDGTVHAPGLLRICMARRYSPVAGLHETWVNGSFAGLFLSRVGQSEGPVERNGAFVFFRRNDADQWELHGYALPDGDGLVTYRMQTIERQSPKAWIAERGPTPATPESGLVVLLAADVR